MPGTSKNAEAAAVSLPSQLRRETAVDRDRWVWRTPLEKSQPFWYSASLQCGPQCQAVHHWVITGSRLRFLCHVGFSVSVDVVCPDLDDVSSNVLCQLCYLIKRKVLLLPAAATPGLMLACGPQEQY